MKKSASVSRKWPIDKGIALLDGVELVFKEAHMWGNRFVPRDILVKPTRKGFCPFPWEMLTVHWNGDCSVCCLDYNRDIVIGNILESSIEEIYTGEKITRIRNAMARGVVTEPLCQVCLGGLYDRKSEKSVKRPQSSPTARLVNSLSKYGVYQSARFYLRGLIEG